MATTGNQGGNRLIATLPQDERDLLMRHMERVPLQVKQVLYEPNKVIDYVYFPLNIVGSLLVIMGNGEAVEVGTVGNEGMVGLPVFLGAPTTTGQAFCQVPGDALRMPSEEFVEQVVARGGALYRRLHRYTQALFVLTAQGSACNRLHSIEQRFCRWMLMTHDRVGRDTFALTQEFIAQMLGVRRAGVSEVASTIQKAGLLRYTRGVITILDRAGLEAASCECYAITEAEFERVFM